MKRVHQIGDVFDQLTIIGFGRSHSGRTTYTCRCACGQVVQRRANLLTSNKTNNCGCRPRGKWRGAGRVSSTMIYRLKKGARRRGIEFEVSIEYLAQLFERQRRLCALSGLEIGFGARTADPSTASLDRIDSSKGYIEGNVQWVHKDINLMKMDLPEGRFKELCARVAGYFS